MGINMSLVGRAGNQTVLYRAELKSSCDGISKGAKGWVCWQNNMISLELDKPVPVSSEKSIYRFVGFRYHRKLRRYNLPSRSCRQFYKSVKRIDATDKDRIDWILRNIKSLINITNGVELADVDMVRVEEMLNSLAEQKEYRQFNNYVDLLVSDIEYGRFNVLPYTGEAKGVD